MTLYNGCYPIFNQPQAHFSEYDGLICPACGNDELHQDQARVYFRHEDSDTGVATKVDKETLSSATHSDQERNPSPRRDGVAIRFWCEHCSAKPVLNIMQHKGKTYMNWTDYDKRKA